MVAQSGEARGEHTLEAIVLLFTKQTIVGCEEFIYPNITEASVTVDSVPNQIYSQGLKKSRFYEEAQRFFGSKNEMDQYVTPQKFYKDKFARS